jgi:hypothetical protein
MTIHVKARVEEGGRVMVDHLPLPAGQEVALTIVAADPPSPAEHRYPLRGSVYRYDDPFGPATDPDDWEANR